MLEGVNEHVRNAMTDVMHVYIDVGHCESRQDSSWDVRHAFFGEFTAVASC